MIRKARWLSLCLVMLPGLILLAALISFLSIPLTAAAPGIRYVAPGGDCGGANPCDGNVQEAVDAAAPGDTILIATGIYTDPDTATAGTLVQVSDELTLSGGYTITDWTTPNPISYPTILDADYQGRVLYANAVAVDPFTVTLSGLTFRRGTDPNLEIREVRLLLSDCIVTEATGRGLILVYGHGSRLVSSTISDNGGMGLWSELGHEFTLIGNTIRGNGGHGAYLYDAINSTFSDNLITGNQDKGLHLFYSRDSIVDHNTISGNGDIGLDVDRNSERTIVAANTLAGNGSYGVAFRLEFGYRLDNNIIVENGGAGVLVGGDTWNHTEVKSRHNTVVSNTSTGLEIGAFGTVFITNTIVASHTTGILTTDPSAQAYANTTLWYGNAKNSGANGGGSAITANDLSGDPRFQGGGDPFSAYHLRRGSAAIDAGVEAGLNHDIDGQPRAPDIGADEYDYAVQLGPDQEGQAAPDTTVSYEHTLRNSGARGDTFTLSAASSLGWPVSVAPISVTLDSGQEVTVSLVLTVPAGNEVQVDVSTITATSTTDPAVQATAADTTLVGVGVALEPDRQTTLAPGATITFTHRLTNTGVITDVFELTIHNSQGWGTLVNGSPLTVTAGGSAEVQVRISAPLTAAAGLEERTLITATSQTVPQVQDGVLDIGLVEARPGTRYVALTGRDLGNNCLLSSEPCRTVQQAVDQAQPAESLLIAGGVYTDPDTAAAGTMIQIGQMISLSGGYTTTDWATSNPISYPTILDGENNGRVLYASATAVDPFTVTLTSLTFRGGNERDVEIRETPLVMSNCLVIDAAGDGLYLHYADDTTIANSRFAGNGDSGVYSFSSQRTAFYNNTASANGEHGIFYNYYSYSSLFSHNRVIGNGGSGIDFAAIQNSLLVGNVISGNQGDGLSVMGDSRDLTIDGNVFANNGLHGVDLFAVSDHEIRNNLVIGNGGAGFDFDANQYALSTVMRLRHNTVVSNGGGGGIVVGPYATVRMTNTIVASHTYGILTTDPSVLVHADHTLWYGNDQDTGKLGGGQTTTANDLTGHPGFAGGGDPFFAYHIKPGSPAIDAGAETGLADDIDRDPRPYGRAPDIGADETPIALITGKEVTPQVVQAGQPLTYTIRVTNTGQVSLTLSITDTLPAQVIPSGSLHWAASLSPQETWTTQVRVTATWGYHGPLTNQVQVTSPEGASGEIALISQAIVEPAFNLSKWSSAGLVPAGSPLTYTLRITNTGNVTLTAIVTDSLPQEVSPSGQMVWTPVIGGPRGNWSQTIVVTVAADYAGPLLNQVEVRTAEGVSGQTSALTFSEISLTGLVALNDSPTPLGESTTLSATVSAGSNVSYSWAFGDGVTGQGQLVNHTYSAVGVYTAVVTASNSLAPIRSTTRITIAEPVQAAFSAEPTVGPVPLTVSFTNLSSGDYTTCLWTFGDGHNSAGCDDPVHIYPLTGVYTVSLTVSGPGGNQTETRSDYILVERVKVYLPVILRSGP